MDGALLETLDNLTRYCIIDLITQETTIKTKTIILTMMAMLASGHAFGQTDAQREFCQSFATIMRSAAELRDLGQSKKQVMAIQREAARKANLDKDIAKILLDSVAATYDTNLSPDAVEIINYTICLERK